MGAIKRTLTSTCKGCDACLPEGIEMCELCASEQELDQAEDSLRAAVATCQRVRINVDLVLERIRLEQRNLQAKALRELPVGRPARDDEVPF